MAIASEKAPGKSETGYVSDEQRRAAEQVRTQLARRKQSLDLQRESILSQRTSNPARRAALESALKDIEAQLATLS